MFEAAENYHRDNGYSIKRLARLFVQFVGIAEDDRVLDVGCGTGSVRGRLRACRRQLRSSRSTRLPVFWNTRLLTILIPFSTLNWATLNVVDWRELKTTRA